jgi:hypothetical protein
MPVLGRVGERAGKQRRFLCPRRDLGGRCHLGREIDRRAGNPGNPRTFTPSGGCGLAVAAGPARCDDSRSGGTTLTYLTVLLLAGAAHGQEAIGSATSITPQAEGSHGGKHTLATGSNVYHQDDIETGVIGIAGLRFHDNSDLKVGPKSRVKLDKFIYDPNRSAGSVAIEAAKGSFRFSTGSQTEGSYQVKTPYGTLGIRG